MSSTPEPTGDHQDAVVDHESDTSKSPNPHTDEVNSQAERDSDADHESQSGTPTGTVVVPLSNEAQEKENEKEEDVLIVDWNGPTDPDNPRNWPLRRKWAAALTVSAFTFISPVSSSMVAPASIIIAKDFHITSSVEVQLTISVFVLAYAVGPLILAPLSELFGRVYVLQLSNAFFIAWNFACGWAQNKSQLIAFRFLAGLGGSAPLAVGGGVLSDMWTPDKRGQAVSVYSLAPLLGPVIGPIAGGFIVENVTWRWVFYCTSAASVVVQAIGLFNLQETYAPVLLARKAKQIRANMDPEKGNQRIVRTIYDRPDREWRQLFASAMARPVSLFISEPIIQLFGLYLAFAYGIIYLNLTIIPTLFTVTYHESIGIEGLNYIALGIGLTLAAQVNARLLDRIYKYNREKHGGVGKPEYRLITVIPGTFLLPIGLFLLGWGAEKHVFWLVPDIGLTLIGAGIVLIFNGLQTYIIDAFTQYAASALATVSCLRSLAGFGFPLFAPAMYKALGYGTGDSILAAFAVVVGIPTVFMFWIYGERIRGMSKRARRREAFLAAQRPKSDAPAAAAGPAAAAAATTSSTTATTAPTEALAANTTATANSMAEAEAEAASESAPTPPPPAVIASHQSSKA